jgi:hypothetical protein
MSRYLTIAFAGLFAMASVRTWAESVDSITTDPLTLALDAAHLKPPDLSPNLLRGTRSERRVGTNALLMNFLNDPTRAAYRLGAIEALLTREIDSPHRVCVLATALSGSETGRGWVGNPLQEIDDALLGAPDPLAMAVSAVYASADDSSTGPLTYPSWSDLPNPMRYELARLIASVSSSERFRKRAFRKVADWRSPNVYIEELFENKAPSGNEPDFRTIIEDVEWNALAGGLQDLAVALEDFADAVAKESKRLPEIEWRCPTPLGEIVFSSRRTDSKWEIDDPLIVVDLHGDDRYRLGDSKAEFRSGTSIVYDAEGDDAYDARPGTGASGIFGYGLQWDAEGDDTYRGTRLAQRTPVAMTITLPKRSRKGRRLGDARSCWTWVAMTRSMPRRSLKRPVALRRRGYSSMSAGTIRMRFGTTRPIIPRCKTRTSATLSVRESASVFGRTWRTGVRRMAESGY